MLQFNKSLRLIITRLIFVIWIIKELSQASVAYCSASNMIEPVKYFVDHELELKDLSSRLTMQKTASLIGISGMGKTQLARMYAKLHKDKYNLIWFFDSNADLNEAFIELANTINNSNKHCKNKSCKMPENYQESKSAVLHYLTSAHGWLLIFDNIKINQNSKLSDIINWSHNGHVILCSQDAKNLPSIISIPNLTKNDSASLAESILGNPNHKLIEGLVETFKGYPLLVAQGALFLKDNDYMNASEYANLLGKSDDKVLTHVQLIFERLPITTKNLLYKIAIINNQRFSKSILSNITTSEETLAEDIYHTIRFGLVMREQNNTKEVLEMHDMIKDSIRKIAGKNITKENISLAIDKLNAALPKGVMSRYQAIIEDETMLSNLEEVLKNAEIYDVDIYKIMELRKNLMNFYLSKLSFRNCQKMTDWMIDNQSKFSLLFMSDKEKAMYAMYLTDIGIYEEFSKSNFQISIKYLNEAEDISKTIKGYPEMKFTIYAQLAQVYAYNGDIKNALMNLNAMDEIIKGSPTADFDMGLAWFIKAKLSLMQGDYNKALDSIFKNIEAEAHLPQDSFTAPTYILQSEILNFMGRYSEAYQISARIYKQETKNIKEDHEIHARTLLQLSRAALGLGKAQDALKHARRAKEIYINTRVENGGRGISDDVEVASVLVAEGDALAKLGQIEEAADSYATAESMFFNAHRENMNNLDYISHLYYNAAMATYRLKDKFWYNKFSQSLFKTFGREHFRSVALLKVSSSEDK